MTYPTIGARWFTSGGNTPATRIVIHRTESHLRAGAAKAVANYFHVGTKKVSAHLVADADVVYRCVADGDIAFAAPPNKGSLHVELCGRSADADWGSPPALAMLELASQAVALWCREHDVPATTWLSVDDLKAGKRGITSHANVALAWKQTTHTDPGPHFPVAGFLALVRTHLAPAPPSPQEIMVRVPNSVGFCFLPDDDLVITDREGALFFFDADGKADAYDWVTAYNAHPDWWGGDSPTANRACIGVRSVGDDLEQVFDDGARYRVPAKR